MKLTPKIFYAYLLFLIAYAALVLLPAPKPAELKQFNITATGLRLIDLTIIVLVAIIWYAGFFGYCRLRGYASLIRKDRDGQQIAKLTRGVFFLVMWLPVSSTVSALLQLIANKHPGALGATIIIKNYINLIFPLIGFAYIGYGANGLAGLVRKRPNYRVLQGLVISLIYIGLIYLHLVATTNQRGLVYHMSLWGITLTVVAPYIYMWFVGLIAAYQIYCYQKNVAGIVYRKSWNQLAIGFAWLVVASIIFQYITTLSARLQRLSIYWLLAIVYALLLILSVGFVLIAVGAKKLRKIEEA